MAEIATLARPYANAVFELAKGRKVLDDWSKQLALVAAVAAEPSVKEIIDSPASTNLEKSNTLVRVCGDDLSREGKQFLHVLARNKRLDLLEEISTQYEALRAQEESTLEVEIVSAYAEPATVSVHSSHTADRWGLYLAQSPNSVIYERPRVVGEGTGDRGRVELGALVSFGKRLLLLLSADVTGTSRRGWFVMVSEDGGSNWNPP